MLSRSFLLVILFNCIFDEPCTVRRIVCRRFLIFIGLCESERDFDNLVNFNFDLLFLEVLSISDSSEFDFS
jgi:hypothetical protein